MTKSSQSYASRSNDHVPLSSLVENIDNDHNMPPARRGRSPNTSKPLHAEDTDQESEPETPRPQKTHLRKRLSEVQIADNDGTDGRVKSKPVNINDDAAEKRRRRKSTRVGVVENALAGPSSEGESSKVGTQKQLSSLATPEVPVPLDIMSSNFEEWMKMATDNVRSEAHTSPVFVSLIILVRKSMLRTRGISR